MKETQRRKESGRKPLSKSNVFNLVDGEKGPKIQRSITENDQAENTTVT